LTSMGDVIHTLPALQDAHSHLPELQVDFVVEKSFAEIPLWHASVNHVIPVETRAWRKNIWAARSEISKTIKLLRSQQYDLVIDAQGLGKSAFISLFVRDITHGYDRQSIREKVACLFYQRKHAVKQDQHAIHRIRQLFAQSLAYAEPDQQQCDYGINTQKLSAIELPKQFANLANNEQDYCVFLHGTTWRAKEWPEQNWRQLAAAVAKTGKTVLLPWGNERERQRAENIAHDIQGVYVLEKMNLSQLAVMIKNASSVVAVDTGLGHLSAALATPTISIYGPTDKALIGTLGKNQQHLSVANAVFDSSKKNKPFDYDTVSPDLVLSHLNL